MTVHTETNIPLTYMTVHTETESYH
jgi:hypothetical protein